MKKQIIALLSITLLCITGGYAQDVKIVFDLTSADENVHASTIRHVKGMSEAYPDSEFEVVIYGGAVPMILKDKSSFTDDVLQLGKRSNVDIVVCQMALKKRNLNEAHLLTGVGTVPDGIIEIVNKQNQGWGYIKESN